MKAHFPKRLVEGDDAVSRVLRAELERDEEARALDFEALRARRARRQVNGQRWLAAALVLGTTGLFALLIVPRRERTLTAEAITAEALPESPRATTRSEERSEVKPPTSSKVEPHPAASDVRARATGTKPIAAASAKKNDSSRAPTTPKHTDCRDVVRTSGYEAGARCYADKAEHGSGVSAEVAWIERARIESRALGRPGAALETLAAYEQRFPNGTLATEARLTSIELLAAVGRREEALRAIDDAAPRIPERAGSLHLLGARLALETNACALAAQHLDAALSARAPTDRIEALKRSTRCFADDASHSE